MKDVTSKAFELELETRQKVSESLSKIEIALSRWDAAKTKPKNLEKRMRYLRMSHSMLSQWAKESLKGKKDLLSTVTRLRSYTKMCAMLDKARVD